MTFEAKTAPFMLQKHATIYNMSALMHKCRCFVPELERGYLTIGLAIALGVASLAVMGLWAKLGAVQQELSASKAAVALWRDSAEACSEATKKAKAEADSRAAAAQDALQRARKASVGHIEEAKRLKALMGQKPVTACGAQEAVSRVRQGLVK